MGSKLLFRYSDRHLDSVQIINNFVTVDVEKVYASGLDYISSRSPVVGRLDIPFEGQNEVAISEYNGMYNTSSRHVYFCDFLAACFIVDLEKMSCEWLSRPNLIDSSWRSHILLHPTGLLLNVVKRRKRKRRMDFYIFGRSKMRMPSLYDAALGTVIQQSSAYLKKYMS